MYFHAASLYKLVLCLWLILSSHLAAMADVSRTKSGTVLISGSIKPADFARLRELSRSSNGPWFDVQLDSIGGDVATAVAMGKLLREKKAWAAVYGENQCMSACVFLLAGAVRRTVNTHHGALVGIHRPYDPLDKATTLDEQKAIQIRWQRLIGDYLNEVNIPGTLYEAMHRVSPDSIRILSPAELSYYGLNRTDPYQQDADDTKAAQDHRMTKQEYLQRRATARAYCARYKNTEHPRFGIFTDLVCEANLLKGRPPLFDVDR